MGWEIIEKAGNVEGLTLRKYTYGVYIYIGDKLRKKLKIGKELWCNVYKNKTLLLVQFTQKPNPHSRRISRGVFALPRRIFDDFWNDTNTRKMLVPQVEGGNLIIDLRDLQ